MLTRFIPILSLFLALLSSCATQSPWQVDAINSGTTSFDSTRLRYISLVDTSPYLTFELMRIGDNTDAFINLTRPSIGKEKSVEITFTIDNQKHKRTIELHEGKMRLLLPNEITSLLIESLQDRRQIAILINGCEETLDPAHFGESFSQFQESQSFFKTIFKRP